MKKQFLTFGIVALMGVLTLTSCEKEESNTVSYPVLPNPSDNTIAGYIISNPEFSILKEALVKADLAETFMYGGQFTVFAPDNNAFLNLFSQLGISSLESLSAETLRPILLYHVLAQYKVSTMLSTGYFNTLSPAFSGVLDIKVKVDDKVTINKTATVTTADKIFSNGVVHVIDAVLLPPTVVDKAVANDDFSILVQAVVKAGLAETLSGSGPYTVFAPTNSAFENLFEALGVSGIQDLTAEQLTPILLYHVVQANVLSSDLSEGQVETLGGLIDISLVPVPSVNSSQVIGVDFQAANGVIHAINEVLLPSKK